MRKHFIVIDVRKIEKFLGKSSDEVVVVHDGEFFCKLRARRIDRVNIKIDFQDYDGSRFCFIVDTRNRLAVFESNSFSRFHEYSLLDRKWQFEKIWNAVVEVLESCE